MKLIPKTTCAVAPRLPVACTARRLATESGQMDRSNKTCAKRVTSYSAKAESDGASTKKQKPSRNHERHRQADRELLLDVLSSSATKRDARSYLSRFAGQPQRTSPADVASSFPGITVDQKPRDLRAAVFVIRSISSIDDATLSKISHTIAQLSRLGQSCILVVDDNTAETQSSPTSLNRQLDRLITLIDTEGTVRARRLSRVFESAPATDLHGTDARVSKLDTIYSYLAQDSVVVLAPVVHGDGGEIIEVNANRAVSSLANAVRLFQQPVSSQHTGMTGSGGQGEGSLISLDRLIIIDPHGGIPNVGLGGSHVFVNLTQEFEDISSQLQGLLQDCQDSRAADDSRQGPASGGSSYSSSSSSSSRGKSQISKAAATMSSADVRAHLENLALTRGALALLPATSSALIITPSAAAFDATMPVKGVGTRSARNPLIHNLLTDKPFFSSSLPRMRLSASDTAEIPTNHPSMFHAPPTYLKHGVPVIITPDPLKKAWLPPADVTFSLSLDDSSIDKTRLVNLIEDSFGRPLDTEDYFKRIRPRLAGIIIAGDYEGGAILTWEQPKASASDRPTPTPHNPTRLVPYLDKFAVLRKSQGGGVADVVFSAMVRRCFPHGVCWRSRNGNPVNKWYFERSQGSLKLPVQEVGDQAWTMFWTTENLQADRFREYAQVCLAVKSSWADGRKALD